MMTPKMFKQSPIRTAGNVFTSLVCFICFCFSAVLGLSLEGPWDWSWIVLACAFALLAIYFGGLVLRPLQLTLNSEGFVLSGGWMRLPRFVAWHDIDGPMSSYSIGRGQGVIVYNLINVVGDENYYKKHLQPNFTPDATLPSVWREDGQQVVDELEAYRERALKEAG